MITCIYILRHYYKNNALFQDGLSFFSLSSLLQVSSSQVLLLFATCTNFLHAFLFFCTINRFFLEFILGNKHSDFGDVFPQLHSPLQLTHLHLCLQSGRALHRAHQHQLAREAV